MCCNLGQFVSTQEVNLFQPTVQVNLFSTQVNLFQPSRSICFNLGQFVSAHSYRSICFNLGQIDVTVRLICIYMTVVRVEVHVLWCNNGWYILFCKQFIEYLAYYFYYKLFRSVLTRVLFIITVNTRCNQHNLPCLRLGLRRIGSNIHV